MELISTKMLVEINKEDIWALLETINFYLLYSDDCKNPPIENLMERLKSDLINLNGEL